MGQKGFFDVERRLEAISALGDPLETIKKIVPWEDFRTDIEAVTETKPEQRKSNAGRKPYDTILKFKIMVLQSLHNLSDDRTEYLIRDRISFMRFLDLELEDPVPDATTIWLFREALAEAGLIDKLFERFGQHLEAEGYIARRPAQAAQHEGGERGDQGRQDAGGMGEAARQECPEGQGRALDEEERRELLRLQEPCRRGQGAQADPQMGCDGRGRARQSEAGRCARSLQHRQGGLGGQRLPLGPDRGGPEGEGLAEPYPPARRTQSSAVRAPEVGEHDALEGARPCRARIRPPAGLDGRQDRAHHRHPAGEVQDRDDEPRLQHPPAGSARAAGGCAGLSALTGGVRAASCNGARGRQPGIKTAPDRGLTLGTSPALVRSAKAESPKP